jgi:hypothetical protein
MLTAEYSYLFNYVISELAYSAYLSQGWSIYLGTISILLSTDFPEFWFICIIQVLRCSENN